eukprot:MONOS_15936.1-p1 / transcript=MONOS_15936.1 / gene=MONOS_15936 / organism=Monocercomonoides_exilis_PA203 / gene_product=unspecified product / transcript_product=unspecified product / location=Mono_scaffold01417:3321-4334(-) / protein_length=337 / sequence_SO=supercontig / SO=protein_coding / is_pseudo=false
MLFETRNRISRSDVIGVGSYAFNQLPAPGFDVFFSENVLPSSIFRHMKFFFGFGTAGGANKTLGEICTMPLSKKNPNARYLGSIVLKTPDSTPVWGPPKPYRDAWKLSEIEKLIAFVDSMNELLTDENSKTTQFPKFKQHKVNGSESQKMISSMLCPKIDQTKCIKCGKCARECPYNAIKMKSSASSSDSTASSENASSKITIGDIESSYPIINPDECWMCSRCYHHCPSEAIQLPFFHSEQRSRLSSVLVEKDCSKFWQAEEKCMRINDNENESLFPSSNLLLTKEARIPKDIILTRSKPSPLRTLHRVFVGCRFIEIVIIILFLIVVALILRAFL